VSPASSRRQIVIESWRRHYNTIRPHASIGYKPPAPEVTRGQLPTDQVRHDLHLIAPHTSDDGPIAPIVSRYFANFQCDGGYRPAPGIKLAFILARSG
jgi:hypothetical protein